jgi:hypothetical protein
MKKEHESLKHLFQQEFSKMVAVISKLFGLQHIEIAEVLILDALFVHRTRAIEKKDGNPLNEVRIMCNSMLHNNSIMCADNTIRLNPTKSVLKYQVGDEIKLNEADFLLIFKAFFAEIENKYL